MPEPIPAEARKPFRDGDEQWRPVTGYLGYYAVSDQGRVRSLRRTLNGGLLRQRLSTHGYLCVDLCVNYERRTFQVHRLVAEAFMGPTPEGSEVRHLNGCRTDARLSNLTYGTSSENKLDSVQHGTHANASKQSCPQGHEYTDANMYRYPGRPNNRICKTCESDRQRRRREARRG